MLRLWKEVGDVVYFQIMGLPNVVLFDPEDVEVSSDIKIYFLIIRLNGNLSLRAVLLRIWNIVLNARHASVHPISDSEVLTAD